MTKKSNSLLLKTLSLLMVILLTANGIGLSVFAAPDSLPNTTKTEIPADVVLGDSTVTPPVTQEEVILTSEEDLMNLALRVNNGDNMKGVKVFLNQNIIISQNPWTPIGNSPETRFSGTFLGQSNSIRGIVVKEPEQGGLFGYLADATVSNLILGPVVAPKSTSGLFFSAVDTTITNVRLEAESMQARTFNLRASEPDDTWDGTPDSSWFTGSSPYQIKTGAQLADFRDRVNGTGAYALFPHNFLGETIELVANLDMDMGVTSSSGHTVASWIPIGDTENAVYVQTQFGSSSPAPNPALGEHSGFQGAFISNGKTISNLKSTDGGLFGYLENATISGLNLDHIEISLARSITTNLEYFYHSQILSPPKSIPPNDLYGYKDIGTGALAAMSIATEINNINASNLDIKVIGDTVIQLGARDTNLITMGVGAAGIIAWQTGIAGIPSLISNCSVIDSTIESGFAAGIAATIESLGVSQCIVYNTNIIARDSIYGEAAGITRGITSGADSSYGAVAQCISFNNSLEGGVAAAGISSSMLMEPPVGVAGSYFNPYSTVSDNFTTGLTANNYLPSIPVSLISQFPNNDDAQIYGILRNLTDSTRTEEIIQYNAYSRDNFWDNHALNSKSMAFDGKKGNKAMDTTNMTDGWVPSVDFWKPFVGHYPHIKALSSSTNDLLRELSSLAMVALRPDDPTEKYTEGTREIRLMKETGIGSPITWTVTGASSGDYKFLHENDSSMPYKIMYTEKNENILNFSLTASIQLPDPAFPGGNTPKEFTKTFDTVNLVDTILTEIATERYPVNGDTTVPLENPNGNQNVSLTFEDPIEYSDKVTALATLEVQRPNGDWVLDQSILCRTSNPNFIIDNPTGAGPFHVQLNFKLQSLQSYRLTLPENMVKEAKHGGTAPEKKNYSEEIIILFETQEVTAPEITVVSPTGKIEWSDTLPLTWNDIEAQFVVKETAGGAVMHQMPSKPTATLHTATAWDPADLVSSLSNALASMPNESVEYYLASGIVGASPKNGNFFLYVFAKNQNGKTASKTIPLMIKTTPVWEYKPKEIVHMEWTKDTNAMEDALVQGVSAYSMEDGVRMPAPIKVTFDEQELKNALAFVGGPAAVTTTVAALDSSGRISNGLPPITVKLFLDKPLRWKMTPSPITMRYTTKRHVEDLMNVVGLNFGNEILEYSHSVADRYEGDTKFDWNNGYRTDGLFYVDVSSKPQVTTKCANPNCDSDGFHPKNQVDDQFIINIIYPPGIEITNYWGELATEIEKLGSGQNYSSNHLFSTPRSYLLPIHVIESLEKQAYGRVQLKYFDRYRWNFYSNTIDPYIRRSETYSLQVHDKTNPKVDALLADTTRAFQFEFENIGRLFGEVEFEYNLAQLPDNKQLPGFNLGLYRYNGTDNTLELVSDIIIQEEHWASAVITETLPTTYVIKEKAEGDQTVDSLGKIVDIKAFNQSIFLGEKREFVVPELEKLDGALYTQTVSYTAAEVPRGNNVALTKEKPPLETSSSLIGILIAAVTVVVISSLVIFWNVRKKEEK